MAQINAHLRWVAATGGRGIGYWCPGCETMHVIPVEGPHAWSFDGNLSALTLSPSVLVTRDYGEPPVPQRCHSFVRSGRIEFLTDCTHPLAGKTVKIPPLPGGMIDI